MKEIIPLLQTLLWVGLISGILYRYHQLIESIIEALKARIESGGAVRFGPVEFSALAKPLDPKQQVKKLDEDVAQLVQAEDIERPKAARPHLSKENIRALYLHAEDLALREIQSEYQIPISRQVQLGSNLQFDGAFAKEGRLHVVEVKFSRAPLPKIIIEQSVDRVYSRIKKHGWKTTRLIFAVVYGDPIVDLSKEQRRIADAVAKFADTVEIRCYHLRDLAKKYSVALNQ